MFEVYDNNRAAIDLKSRVKINKEVFFIIYCQSQKEFNDLIFAMKRYNNVSLMITSTIPLEVKTYSYIKKLNIRECSDVRVKMLNPKITELYLPRNVKFNVADFSKLMVLYCNDSTQKTIPTLPNLRELYSNCLTKICYQPRLQYADLTNSEITILPDAPELNTLICTSTKVEHLPNYEKLEYLLCFHTTIRLIPESICKTVRYCFTDCQPLFEAKPLKLIESYDIESNIHRFTSGVFQCVEVDSVKIEINK